ncbi:MAG TPA: hypothetical protein VGI03_06775 [Verrucomicrobiae bacterium]
MFHLLFSGFDQSEGGNSGLRGKPQPDPSCEWSDCLNLFKIIPLVRDSRYSLLGHTDSYLRHSFPVAAFGWIVVLVLNLNAGEAKRFSRKPAEGLEKAKVSRIEKRYYGVKPAKRKIKTHIPIGRRGVFC